MAEIAGWLAVGFLPMVFGILTGAGSTATAGAERGSVGADIYGLRISSLLLSPNGYGIGKIEGWIEQYRHALTRDEGIMYNENSGGYLGIVGILGFMLLLVWLFASPALAEKAARPPSFRTACGCSPRLNIAMLLLATVTGFGAMIGIVLRMIRGYNRISPYIAFLAILAVVLCVEQLLQKLQAAKRVRFAACSFCKSCRQQSVSALLPQWSLSARCLPMAFGSSRGCSRPDYAGVQDCLGAGCGFRPRDRAGLRSGCHGLPAAVHEIL